MSGATPGVITAANATGRVTGHDSEDGRGLFEQFVGILLALGAAIVVALSMNLQRYALTQTGPRMKLLGITMKPSVAWAVGIVAYAAGNGLYTVALIFGPLSMLRSRADRTGPLLLHSNSSECSR